MNIFNILKNKRILLVDDDEWIRDSLCIYFESEGCHIDAFETAEEGLAAMADRGFDIIITDYRLPGMDGIRFLEKSFALCPDAVKIMITAYPTEALERRVLQIGVKRVIAKPFTSGIILDCLEEAIPRG